MKNTLAVIGAIALALAAAVGAAILVRRYLDKTEKEDFDLEPEKDEDFSFDWDDVPTEDDDDDLGYSELDELAMLDSDDDGNK